MKIHVEGLVTQPDTEVRVGNVYAVKGGRGLKNGHMNVVFAIVEERRDRIAWRDGSVLMVTIDREGNPVGVTQYVIYYVENLQPIAFVDGLDDLSFVMRSL